MGCGEVVFLKPGRLSLEWSEWVDGYLNCKVGKLQEF